MCVRGARVRISLGAYSNFGESARIFDLCCNVHSILSGIACLLACVAGGNHRLNSIAGWNGQSEDDGTRGRQLNSTQRG